MTSRTLLIGLVLMSLATASCGGPPAPGEAQQCAGEARVQLDCSSEIAYQGVKADGSVSLFSVGSAKGTYEDAAIRKVNDNLAAFVSTQTRLCREYNACVLSRDEYLAEAKKTREVFEAAAHGAEALAAATTSAQKAKALAAVYESVVPEADRPESLAVRFGVDAELPASLGGRALSLAPGAPLPTGARVAFSFWASRAAHLYVFQRSQSGAVKVLFPDSRIGTANPIAPGNAVVVPTGGRRFVLNGEDLGEETIYLAASVKPLVSLDSALAKVASGQVQRLDGDPVLGRFASVGQGPAKEGCETRSFDLEPSPNDCPTRGLELEGDAPSGAGASIAARTTPGDDLILQAFRFQHVTEPGYVDAVRARPAGR
jgi:hypothetical protein